MGRSTSGAPDSSFVEGLVEGAVAAARPWAPLTEALLSQGSRKERVREFLAAARRHVRAAHEGGAGGSQVVELWTRLVDHAVTALFRALAQEHHLDGEAVALLALGGYGREELSPYSDLDLLVLHPGQGELTAFIEGLLYPLWDAGVDVQAVARTIEENVEVSRADHRSRTSLLEGRFLTGDPDSFGRYQSEVVEDEVFGRGVKDFVLAKLAEMEERHSRYGNTVYLLEPQVKEGEGGLRDIQTALWVAKARFKVRSAAELLHKGVLPPAEVQVLQVSRDYLLRVRNQLHFQAGRKEDRLTYEMQDEIAPVFGFTDEGGASGVERFLQTFYATANGVEHFTGAILRRATAGLLPRKRRPSASRQEVRPGVRLHDGEISLLPSVVSRRPLALLAAFEAAQTYDAELSPQALEVIRDNLHLVDDRFRRDPEAVRLFLAILRHPRRVATTLMRMHDVHFLDRFIPEFGRIFCLVQRDLYHTYPVDVHSLFAVQELRRLARGEYVEELPVLTRLSEEVSRPDILYLAALLHDVGKGEGHDHAERGAEIALAVGERMGLSADDREYLVFLVEHHLLFSLTAQGRDLHDEDLIRSFAAEVKDAEGLKMLYLLTVADIRAVGAGAWTSWKNLLFRELYDKALAVIETGALDRALAPERVEDVRERVRRAGSSVASTEEIEAFLLHVDHPQYLLANPVEALVRHLSAFLCRDDEPVIQMRPVPEENYTEVLILTRDRAGLFAQIAGLMAAHRVNILSAVLNTRQDGWALDVFHVSSPLGDVLEAERYQRWASDLRAVLRNEKTFEAATADRLLRRPTLGRRRPRVATRVSVDNEASGRFTVVDLKGADRLGLLHAVARTLSEQGLTIRLAKIATTIEQVADSFYVEQVGGGKLIDPERIAALKKALREAVPGDLSGKENR